MAELPEAFVTHVSEGRVRVKIPARKHDEEYFSQLKGYLKPLPGVQKVVTNPLTGSVLVLHSLDLKRLEDLESMSQYSEMMGLFKVVQPNGKSISLAEGIAGGIAGIDASVKGVSAGFLDLSTLSILSLLGITIWQISRGEVAVPAVTALWYASSLMKERLDKGKGENSQTVL